MMNEGKKGFKVRHKRKVASIEPTKPRNYVAKNAINSGAGAHKDKKKAMKQGDTKHKKDYAEGMEEKFQAQLDQLNEIKKGQKDSNGYSSCWTGYHAAGTKKGKKGGRVRNCVPNEDVEEGIKGAVVGGAAGALITKTPSGAMSGAEIGNKVGDMFNEETDTEGGMAKQQLITAAKLAIKLAERMEADTQLDAWVQTKISLASDYIETVFDFIVNGEQDVDKEVETDEEVVPGITHQHRHGTMKSTSTAMEGAKVDRQAKHITKSMMKAHPGMSKADAEGAAWAHIKHPKKKKKKVKEDAYQIYLDVMLEKSLGK
jgi:hypothetical protein